MCLPGWCLHAQSVNPFFTVSDTNTFVQFGAFADYSAGSFSLTNSFMNAFYTGSFINQAQKDKVTGRLSANNNFGADFNEGLFYIAHPDSFFSSTGISWFVSAKNRSHLDIGFSRDLFKVAFYGNTSFRGQTADFSNFSIQDLQYQQFQFGFIYKYFGAGLSVYNGQSFQNLRVPKASMYTSSGGDYLDFNLAYNRAVSDQRIRGPITSNGIGAGLDLFFRLPVKTGSGHAGDLFLEVSDLGFIRWNSHTSMYRNDTAFHFDGFEIKNAAQLGDTSIHYSAQSLLHVVPYRQAALTTYLPATMDLRYVTAGIRYQFIWGLRYKYNAGYLPYEYVQIKYHFNPHLSIIAGIGYGGYAHLQTPIGVQASFRHDFSFQAGSTNLAGYLAPAMTGSQGLFLTVTKGIQ